MAPFYSVENSYLQKLKSCPAISRPIANNLRTKELLHLFIATYRHSL